MSNLTNSTAPAVVSTGHQERRSDQAIEAATEVANQAMHLNGRLSDLLDRLDPQTAGDATGEERPKPAGFFPTIEDEHTRTRMFLKNCHEHMETIENLI